MQSIVEYKFVCWNELIQDHKYSFVDLCIGFNFNINDLKINRFEYRSKYNVRIFTENHTFVKSDRSHRAIFRNSKFFMTKNWYQSLLHLMKIKHLNMNGRSNNIEESINQTFRFAYQSWLIKLIDFRVYLYIETRQSNTLIYILIHIIRKWENSKFRNR